MKIGFLPIASYFLSIEKSFHFLQNYKLSKESNGTDAFHLDMSLELIDKCSILLKNFKSKAEYKFVQQGIL